MGSDFLRRYTDVPALISLLTDRKITLLDPRAWDDSNDSYYLTSLPPGGQAAMAILFAGAFGVYRNSTGHRHVEPDVVDAAEVIVLASQLLRTVDRAKQPTAAMAA